MTHTIKQHLPIKGIFSGRQMVEIDGLVIDIDDPSISEVRRELAAKAKRDRGFTLQSVVKQNLIVNSGRQMLARLLAGDVDTKIDAVQFGDCKVGGLVSKDTFPPDLSDNRLVNEIRRLDGAPGGTFQLDGYSFPAQVTKSAPAGLPGTLTAGAIGTLIDVSANFVADGVDDNDVVNVVVGGVDYTFAVRAVLGPTELQVENTGGIAGAGLSYTVTTPAGQVLFRKFVSGNNFPTPNFGPTTIAHEAGLLFDNGALFNRVVFAPSSPDVGLIFQAQNISGVTLGVQVDWLIVF